MTEISNFIPGVKRFRSGTYNSEFTFPPELAILENEYERKGSSRLMKRIDFENGTVTGNILGAALPMLVAQILNLLYNIVDRIYIARIPGCGHSRPRRSGTVLSADRHPQRIRQSLWKRRCSAFFHLPWKKGNRTGKPHYEHIFYNGMCQCHLFDDDWSCFCPPPSGALRRVCRCFSLCISIHDALSHRHAAFHDRSRHESFYQRTGIFPCWYVAPSPSGAAANLLLDPLFIFVFGLGVQGAAVATVLSQLLSASFVLLFLTKRAELRVRFLRKTEFSQCSGYAKNIVSLGTSGFVMQLTNSLVTICCNNVLSVTGGDIYISVMTIISSVRQLVETPIYALTEGTSPILSYNYGARRPSRVKNSGIVMALMVFGYTAIMWSLIILAPGMLIRIFSSDSVLVADAIPALKQYFAAFIFMDLQYIGQTTFKSLNKKKQAIFFSLLRKVFIVVPLTYLMPYTLHMGTAGVFLAEPVSNVIGGSFCFITMLCTILPELKRMGQDNAAVGR